MIEPSFSHVIQEKAAELHQWDIKDIDLLKAVSCTLHILGVIRQLLLLGHWTARSESKGTAFEAIVPLKKTFGTSSKGNWGSGTGERLKRCIEIQQEGVKTKDMRTLNPLSGSHWQFLSEINGYWITLLTHLWCQIRDEGLVSLGNKKKHFWRCVGLAILSAIALCSRLSRSALSHLRLFQKHEWGYTSCSHPCRCITWPLSSSPANFWKDLLFEDFLYLW